MKVFHAVCNGHDEIQLEAPRAVDTWQWIPQREFLSWVRGAMYETDCLGLHIMETTWASYELKEIFFFFPFHEEVTGREKGRREWRDKHKK
jgi:hypothetical protein